MRAVELHARQTDAAGVTGSTVVPTTGFETSTTAIAATPTDAQPTQTPPSNNDSNGGGNGNNGGGGGTSPLLFFVALGFGVVFTNLW